MKTTKHYLVLWGYGTVGKYVVKDLFRYDKTAQITIWGRDLPKAQAYARTFWSSRVKAVALDFTSVSKLASKLKPYTVVINCLRYQLNMTVMKACLAAKQNYVDLGALREDIPEQVKLSRAFADAGKIALLSAWSSPGIMNMMAVYAAHDIDHVKEVEMLFADKSFDKRPAHAWDIQLPYSFHTLYDEITMEPAIFEKWRTKLIPALSGSKKYKVKWYGVFTCYDTTHDEVFSLPRYFRKKGIKSLHYRMPYEEDMIGLMHLLAGLGFASQQPLRVGDTMVTPMEMTEKIMSKFLPRNDVPIHDQEILRIIINKKTTVDVINKSEWYFPAGIVNTATGCSVLSRMLAGLTIWPKWVSRGGVYFPEDIMDYKQFFIQLQKRWFIIKKNEKKVTFK